MMMKMMIDYSNNISYTNSKIEWTQWTYPSYSSKFAKSSTSLLIFEQFLSWGMSSDLSTDTGHPYSFECSKSRYNNSKFSIFWLILCVKLVLKEVKDKIIKKFYLSEGMSTMSSVSSILKRFSKLCILQL
jgi:hypothetical protein